MAINILSPDQLIELMVQAAQAASPNTLDVDEGSIPRAMWEGSRAVDMFLQQLAVQVAAMSRLATSVYADKITFVKDFNYTPPGAAPANGIVTFARRNATNQAFVPVGAILQAQQNPNLQFSVYADPLNTNYNPVLNGYIAIVGTYTIDVPAICLTAGDAGNVAANIITVIASPITYIDTVNNAAPFVNGQDAPTDAQLVQDFYGYLSSLSRGTPAALIGAVESIQANLDVKIVERLNHADFSPAPAVLYAVVDDGSGSPPSELLASAYNVMNLYRGGGILHNVYAPITVTANVSGQIVVSTGYDHTSMVNAATTAIQVYIKNICKIGVALTYTRLFDIIYESSPGIINVKNVTLNSGTSDISPNVNQKIIPGTITIAVTT